MDNISKIYELAEKVSEMEGLTEQISILDAAIVTSKYYLPSPPSSTVVITNIVSGEMLPEIQRVLLTTYPLGHSVYWRQKTPIALDANGEIELENIDDLAKKTKNITLIILPLGERTSFEEFQELIAHLRSPEGCPWDREQTHQSLRPNLLEEAYETLTAIDNNDSDEMQEEFGDLLLQVVLQTQIAAEAGEFRMSDVIRGIHTKLVNRHPHVFGDMDIEDAAGVKKNWEKLKSHERQVKGEQTKGVLDGIPDVLPALAQADAYQKRAARVGFDWPEISGVLEKISEEIEEVHKATSNDYLAEEIGDLLFALANFARWKKIDPESALRSTNNKFLERFAFIEKNAKEQGMEISDLSLDEMEVFWEQAKGG